MKKSGLNPDPDPYRFDLKCWILIRIRIEIITDPKHWKLDKENLKIIISVVDPNESKSERIQTVADQTTNPNDLVGFGSRNLGLQLKFYTQKYIGISQ